MKYLVSRDTLHEGVHYEDLAHNGYFIDDYMFTDYNNANDGFLQQIAKRGTSEDLGWKFTEKLNLKCLRTTSVSWIFKIFLRTSDVGNVLMIRSNLLRNTTKNQDQNINLDLCHESTNFFDSHCRYQP